MTPLRRIISGGQTGADQAGLRAAKALGIATGGMMPKGWRTEAGPRPEFKDLYGLEESKFSSYPPRTRWNVHNATGTVIFVANTIDGGSAITRQYCDVARKPVVVISFAIVAHLDGGTRLREWLELFSIQVLNVAGNRESRTPGIGSTVESYLRVALMGYAQPIPSPCSPGGVTP